MSQLNRHFLISCLCLTIALLLPLVTYAEAWQEYGKILASFLNFLAVMIYSLGIIAFAWIKQKETLKWWTVFIFPLAFFVYRNFIKVIDVERLRLYCKNIPENMLSFGTLINLILIAGLVITIWIMIRYCRQVATHLRK